jgi:hypothetical protein
MLRRAYKEKPYGQSIKKERKKIFRIFAGPKAKKWKNCCGIW